MPKAQLIPISHPRHHQRLAQILLRGGIVGALWGYHLYFLACNAYDSKAVKRMNQLKGRAEDQVFVTPGGVEEAEEFADIKKSLGFNLASKKMGMEPLKYLEFLFKKFPLGVELYAKNSAPSAVTFPTNFGKTIWIAGHMADSNYSKFLAKVRDLRRAGQKLAFAGTSLNLRGENTMTVKQLSELLEHFQDKIDAISVYPEADKLKKVRYKTSCSVVSFLGKRPRLLRVGCSSAATLQKYIPDLLL